MCVCVFIPFVEFAFEIPVCRAVLDAALGTSLETTVVIRESSAIESNARMSRNFGAILFWSLFMLEEVQLASAVIYNKVAAGVLSPRNKFAIVNYSIQVTASFSLLEFNYM